MGAVRLVLGLLALFFFISFSFTSSSPTGFIHPSCKGTEYPSLCEKFLSSCPPSVQRSPRQLAQAALTATANRALAASSFVRKLRGGPLVSVRRPREGGAMRDCLETLNDSVDRMRRSAKEMDQMESYGSGAYAWHLSNVKTWVSAALTDENTCLDSLSQDQSTAGVRVQIRRQVVDVSQLTSNALVLVNRLDSRKY